jgi:metallo-beta-lactamase family protein
MKITFIGAAKTTTGSMHLLEVNGSRILLDCGLMQGRRKIAFEKNRNMPFDPASIDMVLLSHAHIDHSGNLPSLTRNGFKGKIIATTATKDLCEVMLADSAYLQMRDVEYVNKKRKRQGKTPFEPLYTTEDAEATMHLFQGVDYEAPIEVAPGVTVTYHDAGHILGSAMIAIDADGKRLFFTGDMGRSGQLILRDPKVIHDVDYLITESTYANRDHPPKPDVQGRLKAFVEDIVQLRSKMVIPCFSVGRTQNVVYQLRELFEQGRIPQVPVFVDSPLSSKATAVYQKHRECYDEDAREILDNGDSPLKFPGLKYITDVKDSKALNERSGPAIIISASGMCEGGRILHHLKNTIEDSRNIILIVGYQAQHTLGRRIVERKEPIKIFGEVRRLEARVHTIGALSAHADRNELMAYFKEMGIGVERAFCVHGEEEQVTTMAQMLTDAGAKDVLAPDPGTEVEL